MRMRAFDKRGYENLAKPHMPSYNDQEKEKIVEQYFLAKRQMNGPTPRNGISALDSIGGGSFSAAK